jgi:hypothetical protein
MGVGRETRRFTSAVLRRWGWRIERADSRQSSPNGFQITLDYPVHPRPRYGYGLPAHPQLEAALRRHHDEYAATLNGFLEFRKNLEEIPVMKESAVTPHWKNGFFHGLDAVALYCFMAQWRPRRFVEVGSGNSTKFVRRAIDDHSLPTHVTSIDPEPRDQIDQICDVVIRAPLEEIDLTIFDELEVGDVCFIDGSHRCFTNSDATVALLEVLPRLNPGVFVHVHDIFLPWDYPAHLSDLYLSEQYVVAAYLLGAGQLFDIVLPNFYICLEPSLHEILAPFWRTFAWSVMPTNGTSMWLRKNPSGTPKTTAPTANA